MSQEKTTPRCPVCGRFICEAALKKYDENIRRLRMKIEEAESETVKARARCATERNKILAVRNASLWDRIFNWKEMLS